MRSVLLVALAILAASCGGEVAVFKGTLTSSRTASGASYNYSSNGKHVVVYPGTEPNHMVIDLDGMALTVSVEGQALTVVPGQTFSSTSTEDGTATLDYTATFSGTGSMTPTQLVLNATGATTTGGITWAIGLGFSGTKQ